MAYHIGIQKDSTIGILSNQMRFMRTVSWRQLESSFSE